MQLGFDIIKLAMGGFFDLGKFLLFIGVFFIVLGLIFIFGSKIPYIGRLPGDIYIKKGNFIFYFPLTSSILISIILTLIFSIITRR